MESLFIFFFSLLFPSSLSAPPYSIITSIITGNCSCDMTLKYDLTFNQHTHYIVSHCSIRKSKIRKIKIDKKTVRDEIDYQLCILF